MAAEWAPLSPRLAARIASYSPAPSAEIEIELHQALHRINILNAWQAIPRGARVLELGCGQGSCTAVLAEAVGADGHVDAVDPGPPTYGAPFTLAQAQAYMSSSAVGDRITWHTGVEPLRLLEDAAANGESWDVAVLAHCIWYFRGADTLRRLLGALSGRAKRVCVAEWALAASEPAAVPHVLAALTRAALEAHRGASSENIQTLASPAVIQEVAAAVGWKVVRGSILVPGEGLRDGVWEVGTVVSEHFVRDLQTAAGVEERVELLIRSSRDATIQALAAAGGLKNARAMDVWTGVLETS